MLLFYNWQACTVYMRILQYVVRWYYMPNTVYGDTFTGMLSIPHADAFTPSAAAFTHIHHIYCSIFSFTDK